jgi:hypothetical protein
MARSPRSSSSGRSPPTPKALGGQSTSVPVSTPIIPEPDYDDPKEVYAFFGVAFYITQVCEQGVVNLAVALHASRVPRITRAMIVDLFTKHEGRTFGAVLRAARQLLGVPVDLDKDMERVLRLRNRLAHTFFVEHAERLLSERGRRAAIDELREIARFVKGVDVRLDAVWIAAWEKLGFTKDVIDAKVQEWMKAARLEDSQAPDSV